MQGRFALLALPVSAAASVVFWSATAGLAFLTLFVVAGLLWRRDQPPVLSFCLAYQWVFAVGGLLFLRMTGYYPGQDEVGHLDRAVFFSMMGLLLFALGARAAIHFLAGRSPLARVPERDPPVGYSIRTLFRIVILVFGINWFVDIAPRAIFLNAAEIIRNVLGFRYVLLFMLFLTIARSRRGYRYGVAALIFVLVPHLGSVMSEFKFFLFLVLLVLLDAWRPWLKIGNWRLQNRRVLRVAVVLAVALIGLGLLWEGAVKPLWRPAVAEGGLSARPVGKVLAFSSTVGAAMGMFQLDRAVEGLASRVSSGAAYFSLVLVRVPAVVPHTSGELTWRGVRHVLQPRIFFPDKPFLGSDSWLVRRFAGVRAAGGESGTSVGLGYMAEFYIDYGIPLMFLGLFLYGFLVGFLYVGLSHTAPSTEMFLSCVAILFVQQFLSYEGNFAKQLGGMLQTFIIFSALQSTVGRALHHRLIGPGRSPSSALRRATAHPSAALPGRG